MVKSVSQIRLRNNAEPSQARRAWRAVRLQRRTVHSECASTRVAQ
eukprot:SAG31_NODE_47033_length_252_cov_0.575163_1_plen_44_part_10